MAKSDKPADADEWGYQVPRGKPTETTGPWLSMQPIIEETGAEAEMAEVIVWTGDC